MTSNIFILNDTYLTAFGHAAQKGITVSLQEMDIHEIVDLLQIHAGPIHTNVSSTTHQWLADAAQVPLRRTVKPYTYMEGDILIVMLPPDRRDDTHFLGIFPSFEGSYTIPSLSMHA